MVNVTNFIVLTRSHAWSLGHSCCTAVSAIWHMCRYFTNHSAL